MNAGAARTQSRNITRAHYRAKDRRPFDINGNDFEVSKTFLESLRNANDCPARTGSDEDIIETIEAFANLVSQTTIVRDIVVGIFILIRPKRIRIIRDHAFYGLNSGIEEIAGLISFGDFYDSLTKEAKYLFLALRSIGIDNGNETQAQNLAEPGQGDPKIPGAGFHNNRLF